MRVFDRQRSYSQSQPPKTARYAGIVSLLLGLVFALPMNSFAHSLNDSYLDLTIDGTTIEGTLQLAIADLEIAVGLDNNGDDRVSWGELVLSWENVQDYVERHIGMSRGDSACSFDITDFGLPQTSDTAFLAMPFEGGCTAESGDFTLSYTPMFALDSSHRGIVSISRDEILSTHILNPSLTSVVLNQSTNTALLTLFNFVSEGIWHIWIGIDHILFLVAMLLGVVLYKRDHTDKHGSRWRSLGIELLKLVTAFTVAHSITLVLASLSVVALPAQLVEASIALSVVASGVNIIYPIFGKRHWQFAFLFGLIHGFGFANVLSDLNLTPEQFLLSLLGFNIGVELGQLVIVAFAMPLLVLFSAQASLRRFGTILSGLVVCNIGLFWFLERSI